MTEYARKIYPEKFPLLPLEGNIDLTFRCNCNCRHCWVRVDPSAEQKKAELSFDQIRRIAGEALEAGCRRWVISGGEPLLRKDFSEIFTFLTRKSIAFTLNTNGTLITPNTASLVTGKGITLVSLYGADAETHDHVTRTPGSFAAFMRGCAYLREAGAEFIVQIVPLQANFHQYGQMIELAKKINGNWRLGATWLYLSAKRDPQKNREIIEQRLSPEQIIDLEKPDVFDHDASRQHVSSSPCSSEAQNSSLFQCPNIQNSFHIDPSGMVTFCEFVRDPALKLDLKTSSFSTYWDSFRPSLTEKISRNSEYNKNCGSCSLRSSCSWCPPVSFLEHGRYTAPVDYLCALAAETHRYKEKALAHQRRFFQLAGITIQVDSDLPITDSTFLPVFKKFEISRPGNDIIRLRHHFHLPGINRIGQWQKLYAQAPWKVLKNNNTWIYLEVPESADKENPHKILVTDHSHSSARIYSHPNTDFPRGSFNSLTLFSSDQIFLARSLAERQAFFLHSCGLDLEGRGFLFVGHSEAGKSTITKLFMDAATILCDDRNIVRKWPEGYKIHGTWSHGEVPLVSPQSAPLHSIFFLKKSDKVRFEKIQAKKTIVRLMLACIIRPVTTPDWWNKMLDLIENIAEEIPCYYLHFDRSQKVVQAVREI